MKLSAISMSMIYFLFIFTVQAPASEFQKKNIKFIDYLFKNKQYFECISEARKYQLYSPSNGVEFLINTCYYMGGQYQRLSGSIVDVDFKHKYYFPMNELLSHSYFEINSYDRSYAVSKNIDYEVIDRKYYKRLFSMRYFPLLFLNKNQVLIEEIKEAESYLENDANFRSLRNELLAFSQFKRKSPILSSFMSSVIPGSGQIYSGRYSDGLISFIAVCSTFLGGIHFKRNNNEGYAYTMFFFSGLFYTGNIYGAYNSSKKYNSSHLSNYRNKIGNLSEAFPPSEILNVEELLR